MMIDLRDLPEETIGDGLCVGDDTWAGDDLGLVRVVILAAPACLGLWAAAIWGLLRVVG